MLYIYVRELHEHFVYKSRIEYILQNTEYILSKMRPADVCGPAGRRRHRRPAANSFYFAKMLPAVVYTKTRPVKWMNEPM